MIKEVILFLKWDKNRTLIYSYDNKTETNLQVKKKLK